jgi:diacylglycerol kinase (ATP)
MTATALLHPDVSPRVVEPFREFAEIRIQENLDQAANSSAVLIFGGDGTVHRYLPQLSRLQAPVLVVPSGSGNDFAKALGIRNQPIALAAWEQFCSSGGNVRQVDLGEITPGAQTTNEAAQPGTLFCCVAGSGMDADANARANRQPAWLKGRGGYLFAALRSLIAFRPAGMTVVAEGREIRRSAFLIAVGNAHRYGGGMKIAPRAQPDDGLLDICFVPRMNKLKLLCWLPTIFFGGHLGLSGVEYLQSPHVTISTERALEVYADGECIGRTPVAIRVIPKALRVIVPSVSRCN